MPQIARILAVLALIALLAAPAGAQELKPLPELSPGFDLAGYATQTETVKRDYASLPNIAFEVSLPKTWVERAALGQDFGELTRFDGPAAGVDPRPYFSFKRLQVNRENSAKNEIIAYMLKSGYVLRGLKEIDDRNVEALYVLQDTMGASYGVRAMARIQGPSLLLAEYALPLEQWNDLHDQQTFATRSFKFTKDSDEPIEKRIERKYYKSLSFFYPASWIFEGETAIADNQVVLTLANPSDLGNKGGEIRLGLYSVRSLTALDADPKAYPLDVPALLKDVTARKKAAGFDVGEPIEHRTPDLGIPTKFATMEIYGLRERKTEYDTLEKGPITQELWLVVFQTDEVTPRTIILELTTPARTQDIYLWSVNTRAFEIILKSIQ
ncbi:MAG TPA: hypothetical protein VIN59_06680 [Alphaproteobacteria bacterium]